MNTGFAEFWQSLKAICFPPVCIACGKSMPGRPLAEDFLFCPTCLDDIKLLREPLCRLCGKPFSNSAGGSHLCSTCLHYSWHFSKARALVYYKEPMAKAVQSLKYLGRTNGLSTFVTLRSRSTCLAESKEADLLLPVPLHPRRLRERGFNQAQLLAQSLFPEEKHKVVATVLERCKWTLPQTGLSGPARRKNVKGAFRVKKPDRVKGKKILLVDDVYTTGATVDECARVLQRAGARDVQVLTLARAGE